MASDTPRTNTSEANRPEPTEAVSQVTTVDLMPRELPAGTGIHQDSSVRTPDAAGATARGKSTGVIGEEVIWEARYSLLNFVGRITTLAVLGFAWIGLAVYVWAYEHPNLHWVAVVAGFVLLAFWLGLLYRIILARYGHFYRLTTRRLFVMTGVFTRRRDQVELIKINDVYTRQNVWGRLLGVGTVVVNTTEDVMPMMYLPGIEAPKQVMDQIWHYARAERDTGAVKVDEV